MEYRIIKTRGIELLIKLVNEAIDEGWECQGGVVYSRGDWFYQAMVFEE